MIAISEPTHHSPHRPRSDARLLRRIFSDIHEGSCPGTYNFHMHTTCSDGKLTVDELMQQVMEIGLEAFAITDHHTINGFYAAKAWLEHWQWSHPTSLRPHRGFTAHTGTLPKLFTGIEITSLLAGTEVHILGYGFGADHPSLRPYVQKAAPRGDQRLAEQVIQAIQAAGGLAVLAHPGRYRQPADSLIPQAAQLGIDGIETYYAYGNPAQWVPCPRQTPQIEALARQFNLLTTCGTDTHGKNLLQRL